MLSCSSLAFFCYCVLSHAGLRNCLISHVRPEKTKQDHTKPFGTIQDHTGPNGSLQYQMGTCMCVTHASSLLTVRLARQCLPRPLTYARGSRAVISSHMLPLLQLVIQLDDQRGLSSGLSSCLLRRKLTDPILRAPMDSWVSED